MSVLPLTLPDGRLTIDSTSMHTHAWNVTKVLALWMPPDVRGTSVLMSGSPGYRPKPKRPTITRRSLPIAICGEVDPDGAPFANPWVGLETNIDQLRSEVIDPTLVGDGTRYATLRMPSGSERGRPIHVLGLSEGRSVEGVNTFTGVPGVVLFATLDVEIPDGSFVAGGS